jgi:Phage tail lysozyme
MASFPTESSAVSGGYYMNDLISEAEFLMANGYSQAAAAGIAGTTAGESAGNPESVGSGGAGLIGWTPPSSASPNSNIVTGNRQQDFDNQLTDLLNYANSNSSEAVARGGVNLSTLKSASDPVQAASWWSAFEGPLVPGSDIRSNVAQQVFTALNGYKPNSGYTNPSAGGSSSSSGSGSTQTAQTTAATQCVGITLFGHCFGQTIPSVSALEGDVLNWLERLGLFILGGIFVIMGLYIMVKDTGPGKTVINNNQQPSSSGKSDESESTPASPVADSAADVGEVGEVAAVA